MTFGTDSMRNIDGIHEEMIARVSTLEDQFKTSEARVSSTTVQVGAVIFQSFQDCKQWVIANVPARAFSYVYDSMALLSRVSDAYVQDKDLLESMQHATKSGFQDQAEAKMSSFTSEL